MTTDTHAPAAESDPVTSALADPVVNGRLLAAALAFLGRRVGERLATRQTAEAEEIVSNAQLAALKRRADFDPTRDVVNWLVGFVRNVTRDHVKKYARTPTGPPPDSPGLEDIAVDLGRTTMDAMCDRELVNEIFAQLPANDRELLQLKYFDDLTFGEIAARRGTNENALRVRCYRLIERLRQQYGCDGEVQS